MPYILEIYLEDSWALIFESKFVRIITKKIATRIMDLNQYLDRMSIKTTIIRIHDVGKAYIRLLTSRASILRPGIKVPAPFLDFGLIKRNMYLCTSHEPRFYGSRAHEGQRRIRPASKLAAS